MNFLQNPLPIAGWVDSFISWLTSTFSGVFTFMQTIGEASMNGMTELLLLIPPLLFIPLITIFMYFFSRRKFGLAVFTFLGLLFVYNQGLWNNLMNTVTLVIVASLVSIVIGVPLGILMAKSSIAKTIITPVLDFMQTMPAFVYLIPAVAFFGIGMVPGVFASVIFALPPTVRFTNLGIQQVPTDLREASESFGSTGWQKLFKLELPLAKETIFAGINQTTMLALSMVVTASMIGAPGLGEGVLTALQRAEIGSGFVSGVSLVILAIIIDRITQNLNKPRTAVSAAEAKKKKRVRLITAVASLLLLVGGTVYYAANENTDKKVTIGSMQWDSEIASASVIAEVLEDLGYDVDITYLDNAVMWNSVATGESDATVAPWLPTTQGALLERYGDQMVHLGPNLVGAQNGLAVPTYMEVDSIEELTDEAGKHIVGIEPGAGITELAQELPNVYDNLSDWNIGTSSTGAMTVELGQAIENQEEIIVTGWTPHWMFEEYDLKFLEDPLLAMGEVEEIHTFTREGLEEDMPEVYEVLDNFSWTVEDMQSVMLDLSEGMEAEAAARKWVEENPDKVAEWIK
ncbi:ABC transporter permease/substrate binding protein [Jeotgalibaca caeni]|uniref:ABC transporter permease/substrate binding protein n=1 Tax=Jeotgalibaca caeni TaxID=3028623 RepID=UPI00237E3A35|nr:ABC transporter permease/substrate binding protein [Jeotgalibaca caeni]MDE1549845.1 ABC transporter permease/substrate binding protein [Jeotgalibaca caeni]